MAQQQKRSIAFTFDEKIVHQHDVTVTVASSAFRKFFGLEDGMKLRGVEFDMLEKGVIFDFRKHSDDDEEEEEEEESRGE